MDRVSVNMVRAALVWLALGVCLGAVMLTDHLIPGTWRFWFGPTHGHMLFVGWFLQFAVGVAYWLLPRQRTDLRPMGYNERVAYAAFMILNWALALRLVGEPAPRIGYLHDISDVLLVSSALGHVVAVGIIVVQLWGRVIQRRQRKAED
jgi:hypothetical protein